MNIGLIFSILRSSWPLIAISLAVAVLSALVITNLQPKRYLAGSSVIVNFQEDDPFEGASSLPAQLSGSYMATQLDIIRSEKVALRVIEALDLSADSPIAWHLLPEGTDANSDVSSVLLPILERDLDASLGLDNSRVIRIAYRSTDPKAAAAVANAFARAYIEVSGELSREPLKQNAQWFNEQLETQRERLRQSELRLTEFQQSAGFVALDDRLDTETARLTELNKNLVAAQSELYDVQSRQLGSNHPEYRRALSRERSIRNSVEEQKQRVLELKEQRTTLGALAREVENEQRNYEATLRNYYRTNLEAQFNRNNIAILSPALPPQSPSSPNLALNLISAVLLGLTIPVAAIIIFETMSRRVRTPRDVTDLLGTRVLETI